MMMLVGSNGDDDDGLDGDSEVICLVRGGVDDAGGWVVM